MRINKQTDYENYSYSLIVLYTEIFIYLSTLYNKIQHKI